MSVRPLIPTEVVSPADMQVVGQDLSGLNPSPTNLRTAAVSIGLIAAVGILMAIRNPKLVLPIMTGTLGLSIGAGYIALTKPSTTS